jgi:hypothetical protein
MPLHWLGHDSGREGTPLLHVQLASVGAVANRPPVGQIPMPYVASIPSLPFRIAGRISSRIQGAAPDPRDPRRG